MKFIMENADEMDEEELLAPRCGNINQSSDIEVI